jgi:hypothetical protein
MCPENCERFAAGRPEHRFLPMRAPVLLFRAFVWGIPHSRCKMIERSFLLSLEYNITDVPPNGSSVLCCLAAPVKHGNKDAAGHSFHEYALRQSGLLGERSS